jgi:SPP1 gp7 family putative phage head morphogenesis protein
MRAMNTVQSLTSAKQRNLDPRRRLMKGQPLNPNAAAMLRYQRALEAHVRQMVVTYEREIRKFLKKPVAREYFAADESVSGQAKILMTELARRFSNLFGMKAKKLAEGMIDQASVSSAWSLKSSLKDMTGGLTLKTDILTGELKDVLKASIAENVSLIKSIPEHYHKQVEGAVMRSITNAQGGEQLIPFLRKYRGITERRARMISEDQWRKAYGSINRVRLQKLGLKKFEWLHTSGSQHPRPLHVRMNGHIYNMSQPPVIESKTGERGFPGQLPNCRCRMVPVIDFDSPPSEA